MKKCWCLYITIALVALIAIAEAAKGGRGGGRRGGGRRNYGSRMPIIIQHKNPASANYYENKDVSRAINKISIRKHQINQFSTTFFQGAKIVKASHFELDYMLGRKITFFCMATGFPAPKITWFKDGIELYHHSFFQVNFSK